MVRSFTRRHAIKTGAALGAVGVLAAWPAGGGVEAGGIEVLPSVEGADVARRWRLRGHRALRVHGTLLVAGEAGGLSVAVVRDGASEVAVAVEGGADAPVVFELRPDGSRVARPEVTAELRAHLARAKGRRRPRPIVGPGRAEASHDPGTCAALLASSAALLLLCSRGQGWACGMGAALAIEAIGYCK